MRAGWGGGGEDASGVSVHGIDYEGRSNGEIVLL